MDQILEKQIEGKHLVRAEHFFWILGGHIQKTSEGLLRHLLFSALSSLYINPSVDRIELTKRVFGINRTLSNTQRVWAYDELYRTLIKLVACSDAKFFFLVDALDESEPQDCLGELAGEVLKISRLPNVKICVSCRSWTVFTSKFSLAQSLPLDKMTRCDMSLYVRNRLAYVGTQDCLSSERQADGRLLRTATIVKQIVYTAQGVFLWTELAVKALLSEMRKGCDREQLTKVLAEFPVSLDEYFHLLVFDRIPKTRQNISDTAAALTLAMKIANSKSSEDRHDGSSESFLNFWFLKIGILKPNFSWVDSGDDWYSPEDAERMVNQTRDFVEETCKELLVIVDNRTPGLYSRTEFCWDVQFLHRTVSDFLLNDRVKLTIEHEAPNHFNDEGFLVELRKLRYGCLLRETTITCREAELKFTDMLEIYANHVEQPAWLHHCETLLITRYKHLCKCHGSEHILLDRRGLFDIVYSSTRFKVLDYLVTIAKTWPHHVIRYGSNGILVGLLLGWLSLMFEEPNIRLVNHQSNTALPSTPARLWFPASLQQSLTSGVQGVLPKVLLASLPSTFMGCFFELLDHILWCGVNANQRCELSHISLHMLGDSNPKMKPILRLWKTCGSIWQAWLGSVYLALKHIDLKVDLHHQDLLFAIFTKQVKQEIGKIVRVFLQHGADPTCEICISPHSDHKDCQTVSVKTIVDYITSYSVSDQMQVSHLMQSFDSRIARRDCMRRIVRTWLAADPKSRPRSEYFVSGFIRNTVEQSCSVCCTRDARRPLSDEQKNDFEVHACLDCSGKFQTCCACSKIWSYASAERFVHETIPSDCAHMKISYGIHHRRHGADRAISVLEDWYARGLNSGHTEVD